MVSQILARASNRAAQKTCSVRTIFVRVIRATFLRCWLGSVYKALAVSMPLCEIARGGPSRATSHSRMSAYQRFAMDELKFPEWQHTLRDVILERDGKTLNHKIEDAERLISLRLLRLQHEKDSIEERQALTDALYLLRLLKRKSCQTNHESELRRAYLRGVRFAHAFPTRTNGAIGNRQSHSSFDT